MARCRVVKPEFLLDERLVGLSLEARLYIVGAATLADRDGVLENRPLRIKLATMPHDASEPASIIQSLLLMGIFSISEDDNYLKIEPWDDWFTPFPKEERIQHDQRFIRRTNVEHSIAMGLQGPCNGIAHNKDKDKNKAKAKDKDKDPLFPVRESKDQTEQDWYLEAVSCYPTKDEGHNARSGQFERRRVTRDSPQAQKNFHALVGSQAVTPRELYVCAWLATDEWRKQRDEYCYIPNLSSFFSAGEKSPWAAYIEDAREAIERMDAE